MSTSRRSPAEKLEDIDKKMEQLRQRKKDLQVKVSVEERKKRTRNLIHIGAIFNTNFDVQTPEEAEYIASQFRDQVQGVLKEMRKNQLNVTKNNS